MKIEIKSRWDAKLLFEIEAGSLKLALEAAVKQGADLKGAYLKGANLKGAYLEGAYLEGAYLSPIKNDLWAVLCCVPKEVEGLKQALIEGRVDGSVYKGECACLVGTIANLKHCDYQEIKTLEPDSNRPIERFFMNIRKGDKPSTNHVSKLVVQWIEKWQENMKEVLNA